MKKNVLVTGGGGFIGRELLKRLLYDNYLITCLTTNKNMICDDNIKIKTCENNDFKSVERLKKYTQDFDAVIHLAGIAHNSYTSNHKEKDMLDLINVQYPINLYKASLNSNIAQFLYISTIKVNGEYSESVHFQENSPLDEKNRNSYVKSKINVEKQLTIESQKNDNKLLSIIRPPLVYGENIKGNLETLINIINKGYRLPVKGFKNERSMISVYNLIDFIIHILNSDITGVVKSCCKDIDISTAELVSTLSQLMNKKDPSFYFPVIILKFLAFISLKSVTLNKLEKPLKVNDAASRVMFKWEPRITFAEGIKNTINSSMRSS